MIYALVTVVLLIILFAVLLNLNVTIKAGYDDEKQVFRCTAHYLWLKFVIAPEEEKRTKKRKKSAQKKQKGEKKSQKRKSDNTVAEFVETLRDTIKGVWKLLVSFLRRTTLKTLTLHLTVTGEDAAQTAITYGWVNSIVYPIVGAVVENVEEYEELDVSIVPDFNDGAASRVFFEAVLKIKVTKIIAVLIESRKETENLISAFGKK